MRKIPIENFGGIIDTIEAREIPRGYASRSLNWQTNGNKFELRRGFAVFGSEISGTGKITKVVKVSMSDGTEILLRTRGKKLEYYKSSNETWTEIGTDVLGTDADGKEVSIAEYHSLAGDQIFVNSPYGPFLKIMMADLDDYADIYDSAKNFKGYIKIKQNRTFLWRRKADKTALYGSKIDTQNYTTEESENIGTGDGSTKIFTGTLAFKAGGSKRTCFAIVITDTEEEFTDNNDGTLTGDSGGTGTINYMTGAFSITFGTAPDNEQAITADYQWEDVTDGGIADFTKSATRVAGEGFVLRQDTGGVIQNVFSFGEDEYCVHEFNTWVVRLTADDTNATNLIYRKKVGMPSRNAGVATGDGIYIISRGDDKDYEIKLIGYNYGNDQVVPKSISKQWKYKDKRVGVDLSSFRFDQAVMEEWGDYILCACRTSDSSVNNRLTVYNTKEKDIDIHDYFVNGLAIHSGNLLAADPLADNVYTLYSGFDDDDSKISNYRELNEDDLDFEGMKKCKKLLLVGEIAKEQKLKVSVSIDNGSFVEVGGSDDEDGNHTYAIEGDGSYVDLGKKIGVGNLTVGTSPVAGGGDEVFAYRYRREISLPVDKFNLIKVRMEAMDIGYVSVSKLLYKDIRLKSHKQPAQYVS